MDDDRLLTERLRSLAPASLPDRRAAIMDRARRMRRRRAAGVSAVAALAVIGVVIGTGALTGPEEVRTTTAAPPGVQGDPSGGAVEVELPAWTSSALVPLGPQPVPGYEGFGVVAFDGGTVTGATATIDEFGDATAVVAIHRSSRGHRIVVTVDGSDAVPVEGQDFPGDVALVVVPLDAQTGVEPVLLVSAFDQGDVQVGSVRIAPHVQQPFECSTNTELAGQVSPVGDATLIPRLGAYLPAPLPAACP